MLNTFLSVGMCRIIMSIVPCILFQLPDYIITCQEYITKIIWQISTNDSVVIQCVCGGYGAGGRGGRLRRREFDHLLSNKLKCFYSHYR